MPATDPPPAPAGLFADDEHDGGSFAVTPARAVATWPAGHFVENLVRVDDGALLISLHSHHRIDRYDPSSGALRPWVALPAPAAGMALDRDGTLWVVGGEVGQPPGQVWRVRDGVAAPWCEIPDALFVNGAALHPDGRRLLVADSIRGCVYAVDLVTRDVTTWLSDPRLTPVREGAPGVNGLKVAGGRVHLSITDRNLLLRAPVGRDGGCGPLAVWAERLRADDFVLAADGTAYVATHPANSVLRLGPDGARTTLAGPADGAVGTTAVAFASPVHEPGVLYVTTNGGMWLPYDGQVQPAKLLRLEVGGAGPADERPMPGALRHPVVPTPPSTEPSSQ